MCGIYDWTYQSLYLGGGCDTYYYFAHEFLHAIGLYHEMNRPDRDDYITILWDNIEKNGHSQFRKCSNCQTFGVPYDGRSIMHYPAGMFAIGSKHTMESKV